MKCINGKLHVGFGVYTTRMLHNVYRTLAREAPILYLYIQIILFSIFRILVSYIEKIIIYAGLFSNGL